MKQIYVASRASIPERPAMWRMLRDKKAWPIISTWIDEAGPGQTASMIDLWTRIEQEIAASSGVLLYIEPGDLPLKGAYIECGMALGMGKRVAVVMLGIDKVDTHIGSWIFHPNVQLRTSIYSAKHWLLS